MDEPDDKIPLSRVIDLSSIPTESTRHSGFCLLKWRSFMSKTGVKALVEPSQSQIVSGSAVHSAEVVATDSDQDEAIWPRISGGLVEHGQSDRRIVHLYRVLR